MIDAVRVNYEQPALLDHFRHLPGSKDQTRRRQGFTRLRHRTYLPFGNAREALSEED
jgi:hypothetical protein